MADLLAETYTSSIIASEGVAGWLVFACWIWFGLQAGCASFSGVAEDFLVYTPSINNKAVQNNQPIEVCFKRIFVRADKI